MKLTDDIAALLKLQGLEWPAPYPPQEGQTGCREHKGSVTMGSDTRHLTHPATQGQMGPHEIDARVHAEQVGVFQSWLPDILSKDHRGDCGAVDDFQLAPV